MGFVDRREAAAMGREAVEIINAGSYPPGVELADLISHAVNETVAYPPSATVEPPSGRGRSTQATVTVVNRTSLAAARELSLANANPLALNMASGTHPGGGFLAGARAQEESLCWSSSLYACLRGQDMYRFHRDQNDPIYSDYVIYSPSVPVFRGDDHELLAEPFACSFITCAAVNAHALGYIDATRAGEVEPAMRRRIDRVLTIAATHNHENLILGAWGCGAFACDRDVIAGLFADALGNRFAGVFKTVEFAITDWSPEHRFIGPFERAFGEPTP